MEVASMTMNGLQSTDSRLGLVRRNPVTSLCREPPDEYSHVDYNQDNYLPSDNSY